MAFIPDLLTERLLLRPLRLSDVPVIQHEFSQFAQVQYFTPRRIPWPYPDGAAQAYVQQRALPDMQAGYRSIWALTWRGDLGGHMLGLVDYTPSHPADQLAFWVAKAQQQQGLMGEAMVAVRDYVFHELKQPQLVTVCAKANLGSWKIHQKLGAVEVESGQGQLIGGVMPLSRFVWKPI